MYFHLLVDFTNGYSLAQFTLSHTGDFNLSSSVFYFNVSASVGERSCVQFEPQSDMLVEGDETFTFQAVPRNPLDTFTNNGSTFSITISEDDDGTYIFARVEIATGYCFLAF